MCDPVVDAAAMTTPDIRSRSAMSRYIDSFSTSSSLLHSTSRYPLRWAMSSMPRTTDVKNGFWMSAMITAQIRTRFWRSAWAGPNGS